MFKSLGLQSLIFYMFFYFMNLFIYLVLLVSALLTACAHIVITCISVILIVGCIYIYATGLDGVDIFKFFVISTLINITFILLALLSGAAESSIVHEVAVTSIKKYYLI